VRRKYNLRIHRSQYFATHLQFVGAGTGLPFRHRGTSGRWLYGCPTPNRIIFQEGLLGDEDRNSVNDSRSIGYCNSDCLQTHIMTMIEEDGIPFENIIEQCERRAGAMQRRSEK
jgi:hypothetical protein